MITREKIDRSHPNLLRRAMMLTGVLALFAGPISCGFQDPDIDPETGGYKTEHASPDTGSAQVDHTDEYHKEEVGLPPSISHWQAPVTIQESTHPYPL